MPDPQVLLDRMPSPLLSEWLAHFRDNPINDPWAQASLLGTTMRNLWCEGRRLRPDELIPRYRGDAAPAESDEDQLARFDRATRPGHEEE